MKKIMKIAAIAVVVMGVAATLQPANAICGSPRLFNTGYSYVITPGCEANDCGSGPTSVTDDATGVFWAIGDGDTVAGVGIDNGTFDFLGGWAYVYPGYSALIAGTWADDPGIDGCVDFASDPQRCMAILVMDNDQNTGSGAFALLTSEPDTLGNYSFEQTGNVELVSIDGLSITGTVRVGGGAGIDVSIDGVSLSDISAGLYLDAACPQPSGGGVPGVILGYQVYSFETARDAGPPADNSAANWTPVGPVTPLGDPATVSLVCSGDTDQYIGAAVVFESNFSNQQVSAKPTTPMSAPLKLECGANLADPEDVIERKPRNRGAAAEPFARSLRPDS